MDCPSCGADIPHDRRFAALVVCDYCKSAIVYDQAVAQIAGTMSAIADPIGPLYVGARGRIRDGARFEVMGRVR